MDDQLPEFITPEWQSEAIKLRIREDALEGQLVRELQQVTDMGTDLKIRIGDAYCSCESGSFALDASVISEVHLAMSPHLRTLKKAIVDLKEFCEQPTGCLSSMHPTDRAFHLDEVKEAQEVLRYWEQTLSKLKNQRRH